MGVNCEDFVNKFNSVKDSIDYSKVKNTITYFFFLGGGWRGEQTNISSITCTFPELVIEAKILAFICNAYFVIQIVAIAKFVFGCDIKSSLRSNLAQSVYLFNIRVIF